MVTRQGIRTGLIAASYCAGTLVVFLGAFHVLYVTDHLPMTRGELHTLVKKGLQHGDWTDVRRGIRKGVDPDAFSGGSPHQCLLCLAVRKGDLETARTLRERVSDEALCTFLYDHRTVLSIAIRRDDAEMVSLLLKGGAGGKSVWRDKSPLHVAIECGALVAARSLLEHDAQGAIVDASWLEAIQDPETAARMLKLLRKYHVKFYQYYPYC